MLKSDFMEHSKLWKILGETRVPDHFTCLMRNLCVDQERTIRTGHGTTGSKLGKKYNKVVYCHPAYLTTMQSTSCEMPGWMNHTLESRLVGEKSTIPDRQMTPL